DAFIPYYPRALKENNLNAARGHARYRFVEADVRTDDLTPLVDGAEAVFHLAAMPGLAKSWTDFGLYNSCNLVATQRLLDAVLSARAPLRRFILGSTSSVYGRFASGNESLPTSPISPYGVTKLAAEHLCRAYASNHVLPLVVLRYFSVYGPRQRPDMGYHQFIRALLDGRPVTVNGDGHQTRTNTYVDDCVAATVAALAAPVGETYNVGGGESASVWDILNRLSRLSGMTPRIERAPARPGDQMHTVADTARLLSHLNWSPKTTLDEGLASQIEWQKKLSA
ncbi:MAG: NAD-dependent epimerase/dehydratase family protein, partial [Gemmataceae bacterium]